MLAGGPAIGLCAVTAVPGVVDQDDLDARLVNAVPALGVLLALGLTVAAARETGSSFVPRRARCRHRARLDPVARGRGGRLPSRADLGRVATVSRLYLSLAVGYGLVNLAQDAWNEQLVKRDLVDWRIPSALEPRPEPVWLVILALAALVAVALRRDATVDSAP